MDDTKNPTLAELTERLAAVEFRVNKLDRLVSKLFEHLKRMGYQRTANEVGHLILSRLRIRHEPGLGKEVMTTKLITKDVLRMIPPLNEREDNPDSLVICKFFMPDGAWTWYVIEGSTRERDGCGWGINCHHKPLSEYDPERDDVLFFGYVYGMFPELGYFTLSELEAIRGQFGLPVERDRFFTPCKLSEVR